MYITKSKL